MLIDTHCHINMMVKKEFDVPLENTAFPEAEKIIKNAKIHSVARIINVGTSLVESKNCIMLAKKFDSVFAVVGIHPNDCTKNWNQDLTQITHWLKNKNENNIVGIGECGIDLHYPEYNLQRQHDAFKAQIELALEHNLALVVHSRDAYDETLKILEEYKNNIQHGIMHCFSYDQSFADTVIGWNLALGIGGTITYPKNDQLRSIVLKVNLDYLVLETDAPFLPPQIIRGKKNHPEHVRTIAQFIADLCNEPIEKVAEKTTKNAVRIFGLE